MLKIRKLYIGIGLMLLTIAIAAFFNLDVINNGSSVIMMVDFSTLIIGLLLMLYGFFGKNFYKSILLILASVIISFTSWLIYVGNEPSDFLGVFWIGIPAGIIAGILFLILNHFYFLKSTMTWKLGKQGISFLLILFIVNLIMNKGGDVFFYISHG